MGEGEDLENLEAGYSDLPEYVTPFKKIKK